MRKASRPCCANATTPIATNAAASAAAPASTGPIAATARIAAIAPTAPAAPVTTPLLEELSDGNRPSPPVLSPPQDLPVLGPQCAQDRLQGHAPALPLHFRARQDRA